jgi:hypothetical protein
MAQTMHLEGVVLGLLSGAPVGSLKAKFRGCDATELTCSYPLAKPCLTTLSCMKVLRLSRSFPYTAGRVAE